MKAPNERSLIRGRIYPSGLYSVGDKTIRQGSGEVRSGRLPKVRERFPFPLRLAPWNRPGRHEHTWPAASDGLRSSNFKPVRRPRLSCLVMPTSPRLHSHAATDADTALRRASPPLPRGVRRYKLLKSFCGLHARSGPTNSSIELILATITP